MVRERVPNEQLVRRPQGPQRPAEAPHQHRPFAQAQAGTGYMRVIWAEVPLDS